MSIFDSIKLQSWYCCSVCMVSSHGFVSIFCGIHIYDAWKIVTFSSIHREMNKLLRIPLRFAILWMSRIYERSCTVNGKMNGKFCIRIIASRECHRLHRWKKVSKNQTNMCIRVCHGESIDKGRRGMYYSISFTKTFHSVNVQYGNKAMEDSETENQALIQFHKNVLHGWKEKVFQFHARTKCVELHIDSISV